MGPLNTNKKGVDVGKSTPCKLYIEKTDPIQAMMGSMTWVHPFVRPMLNLFHD
jgi:hypothetical protein